MAVAKRNWYSNIKLIFLVLFLLMFIGYAIRDYRLGNSMVGPAIFGGFLLVIALVFKPWRQGSDEGTPPKKPPSGSAFLLAPQVLADTGNVGTPMLKGDLATTVFWIVIVLLAAGGLIWFLKHRAQQDRQREIERNRAGGGSHLGGGGGSYGSRDPRP